MTTTQIIGYIIGRAIAATALMSVISGDDRGSALVVLGVLVAVAFISGRLRSRKAAK
jgi:hypothetical protein